MKLLINSSTFKGTGVTQVAVSFIYECINFPEHEYKVFMSPNVAANIKQDKFPDNFSFHTFGKHSLYGLKGWADIRKMKRIEADYSPDAVFSVFGPSLWKPKAPHLQGYAFPHYVYPDSPIFKIMSIKEKIGVKIKRFVHIGLMKKEGDYYVCETSDVSMRLHDFYKIDTDKIFTVSNTANSYFLNYQQNRNLEHDESIFRFYCLCSNSPHKNLAVLNKVIPLLKNENLSVHIKFYVTIKNEEYETLFEENVKDSIVNVGPLKVADCPAFVDSCDALFLPTLLECFSASYPEAMILKKPILTSDLPFANTVCENAALYFDPLNAENIAEMIKILVQDKNLYESLQVRGGVQFRKFLSPKERAKEYLNICSKISNFNR